MIDIATTTSTIENLLANSLAGELTEEQSAQFTRLLDTNPEGLDQYLRLIFVAAFLHESQPCSTGERDPALRIVFDDAGSNISNDRKNTCIASARWGGRIFRLGQRLLRAG
jgi:hypothetical protein